MVDCKIEQKCYSPFVRKGKALKMYEISYPDDAAGAATALGWAATGAGVLAGAAALAAGAGWGAARGGALAIELKLETKWTFINIALLNHYRNDFRYYYLVSKDIRRCFS